MSTNDSKRYYWLKLKKDMNELSKSICRKCTMYRDCYDMKDFSCNDFKKVEELTNKQIPMKAIYDQEFEDYVCPRCREKVYTNTNYCSHCGGKLNG